MDKATLDQLIPILLCPISGRTLSLEAEQELLKDSEKKYSYPVIESIPVLINEANSIFSIEDFTSRKSLFFDIRSTSKLKRWFSTFIPEIDRNHTIASNIKQLQTLLLHGSRILVIGGSIARGPFGEFLSRKEYTFVESDVSFGPRTMVICDAHTLPFKNESFDCVVAQAVLEHVVNPQQCVSEIYRVLKPNGLVYSEIPFMQPVHGGAYDFQRFTHSGARLLFAQFKEESSGFVSGHGSALAWAIQYCLLALFGFNTLFRNAIKLFSRIVLYPLRWLDYIHVSRRSILDAACGCYFIGQKSPEAFDTKEIIAYYDANR